MLGAVFPECERLANEADERGYFVHADKMRREKVVRTLASYAMDIMLHRLMLLQLVMFEENFNETVFLTARVLLHGVAEMYREHPSAEAIKKEMIAAVRSLLGETMDRGAKNRRELLVALLNSLPSFNIPTGPGRPQGSTKPAEKKAQEASEFEKIVEEAIQALLSAKGAMPTKTAVAKHLRIGGLSRKTGIDSSLNAFRNKLKRLGLNYDAIVDRVKLNK